MLNSTATHADELKGEKGLLAIWGTAGNEMRHIQEVERAGFPVTVECEWIEPDAYEALVERP